jgi:hypothetical protein
VAEGLFLKLPSKNIGPWARDIISQCSASLHDRQERYARLRNLYLTGDENADAAIFNKTFAYIENVSSYIYSPVELRGTINLPRRFSNPVNRAKCATAADELNERVRDADLDTKIETAVLWALVKGKTFIKTLWADDNFDPYVVQPNYMGVLNESHDCLDSKMEAFFHRIPISKSQFDDRIAGHPKSGELRRKAARYMKPSKENPDQDSLARQVIIGSLTPFQMAGQSTQQNASKGMVDWLGGPQPVFDPKTIADMMVIDELWVWNSDQGDWTTIQMFGDDGVIEGELAHRNIFAEAAAQMKVKGGWKDNPLHGMHPFNEFCVNPLDGYFWGDSEVRLVALLQKSLNNRINGINQILRRQEKPSWVFSGSTSVNQNAYAKLTKPGGYIADSNPNMKAQQVVPEVPQGLYESKAEMEGDFDKMGSFSPVLQGRGESGVRAQGHAETLVRTGSPRFKDRALSAERSVEGVFGLGLNLLQAHVPDKFVAWVSPNVKSAEIVPESDRENIVEEPPAEGMQPVAFQLHHLPATAKARVDSHSGSPAFSHETRQLLFDLLKIGAATPEQVAEHTHPPGAGEMITGIETRAIEQAKFLAAHPEAAEKAASHKKH